MTTPIILNLINELKDTLNGLDYEKHKINIHTFYQGEEEVKWMGRLFNHAYWDSLVFSGRLDELYSPLIQPIQDIFNIIKDHNHYLSHVNLIQSKSQEEFPVELNMYCKWMHKHEKTLLEDIPKMIKTLGGSDNGN